MSKTSNGARDLMSMFSPPPPPSGAWKGKDNIDVDEIHETVSLLQQEPFSSPRPAATRSTTTNNHERSALLLMHDEHTLKTPKVRPKTTTTSRRRMSSLDQHTAAPLPVIDESFRAKCQTAWHHFAARHLTVSTFLGSCIFVLYHIVFCLAIGSSILRPSTNNGVGLMAKTAASGIIFSSLIYIFALTKDIPAMYPTTDLFLAPFLAKLAATVDAAVAADADKIPPNDIDDVFLATFGVLSGLGLALAACLIVLATKFKLANVGAFLPFPVLCGFFTAVGILMWTLAFKVDTNGRGIGEVWCSGDRALRWNAFVHHAPSLCVAVLMKWLGPMNPLYTTALIVSTIVSFYAFMAITGISLDEAKEAQWFWTSQDLLYHGQPSVGFWTWAPPAPFGVWNCVLQGKVHWGAVWQGMSTTCALSFLYVIRCSLHSTALKKNVVNLCRTAGPADVAAAAATPHGVAVAPPAATTTITKHNRKFSEAVDIEAVLTGIGIMHPTSDIVLYRAKQPHIAMPEILNAYAMSQLVSAAVGSFGVLPAISVSQTMFLLGADRAAPQLGAIVLLIAFYLTDFELVAYIPKTAFSSLICLSFIDIVITWAFHSYHKTKDKTEWLVVPAIVIFAFVVGLLEAVFLGIGLSTFLFVGAFFRSGVVKFMATGLTVRSTIERSTTSANWLDHHGDKIQILVLQNYLFFGNASSILTYISSMFEESHEHKTDASSLPPFPKYVILDLTLVSGMDTSTPDIFMDIKNMCAIHNCKLFCSGISSRLGSVLSLGNFKPESGDRSKRQVRFFSTMDIAMGKAEDSLLNDELDDDGSFDSPDLNDPRVAMLKQIEGDGGFRSALRHIDEQHGLACAMDLLELYAYTSPVDLDRGQGLYACDGGPIADREKGLFFIEYGIIKIERDSSTATMTRGRSFLNPLDLRSMSGNHYSNTASLTRINARTLSAQSIQQRASLALSRNNNSTIRLARVGTGWVLGGLELVSGSHSEGSVFAVTNCRLHHLPYHLIDDIEERDPRMVLRLHKLLSHLMARRQQVTIGQLTTLQSIMTSPAN